MSYLTHTDRARHQLQRLLREVLMECYVKFRIIIRNEHQWSEESLLIDITQEPVRYRQNVVIETILTPCETYSVVVIRRFEMRERSLLHWLRRPLHTSSHLFRIIFRPARFHFSSNIGCLISVH